jgi:hypothetical protein
MYIYTYVYPRYTIFYEHFFTHPIDDEGRRVLPPLTLGRSGSSDLWYNLKIPNNARIKLTIFLFFMKNGVIVRCNDDDDDDV